MLSGPDLSIGRFAHGKNLSTALMQECQPKRNHASRRCSHAAATTTSNNSSTSGNPRSNQQAENRAEVAAKAWPVGQTKWNLQPKDFLPKEKTEKNRAALRTSKVLAITFNPDRISQNIQHKNCIGQVDLKLCRRKRREQTSQFLDIVGGATYNSRQWNPNSAEKQSLSLIRILTWSSAPINPNLSRIIQEGSQNNFESKTCKKNRSKREEKNQEQKTAESSDSFAAAGKNGDFSNLWSSFCAGFFLMFCSQNARWNPEKQIQKYRVTSCRKLQIQDAWTPGASKFIHGVIQAANQLQKYSGTSQETEEEIGIKKNSEKIQIHAQKLLVLEGKEAAG